MHYEIRGLIIMIQNWVNLLERSYTIMSVKIIGSKSQFAERDHIVTPFKVKILKYNNVLSNRKKIINGLISEVKEDL